VSDILAVNCYQ